eukprot:5601816-Amphidinium_carterae.1
MFGRSHGCVRPLSEPDAYSYVCPLRENKTPASRAFVEAAAQTPALEELSSSFRLKGAAYRQ